MEEKDKLELEEFIEKLKGIKGRHTELITVYIPAGFNINAVAKQIEQEKSTAVNIKSKNTRKNVLDALERISRHLKLVKDLPKNGLAIFAGNVSEKEGQSEIELWSIEPPLPINIRLYRCNHEFVLEPLEEMLKVSEVYGLLVIDRKDATIGLLEGKQVKVLRKLTSGVPGKQKSGGQSAARFSRITEGMAKEFYRRVADAMKECFFNLPRLEGILIGGPVPTKDDFLKEGELVTALKDKIIGIRDIGYADEHGLELLVEASFDVLAQQEIIHEKKLLEKFFYELAKNPSKTTYGLSNVKKVLNYGAVETLILSKKLSKKILKEYEKLAQDISAKVKLVSVETPEGKQFWSLGGAGALLRFAI